MTETFVTKLNLSVDELALIFSLINQPELGKSVMLQAFGELKPETMDEKLITASHSLLARELASITEKGTVELLDGIDISLFPLIKFHNILQVTINANQPSGPEIVNIYLGKNDHFTTLSIHLGVVYHLTNGRLENLPELVATWLEMPEMNEEKKNSNTKGTEIKMQTLATLDEVDIGEGVIQLTALGFDQHDAELLMNAIENPKQRGSVILTNINSENFQERKLEEAGAGFIYVVGVESSWVFSFKEAHDTTTASVLPATQKLARKLIADILDL